MSLTSLLRHLGSSDAASNKATPEQPKGLTLRDVVLLDVPVAWQEAVALILETLAEIPSANGFPDPATITLSSIGELQQTLPHTLSGHPVKRAAGFLKELMRGASSPPELRVLLDENSTEPPNHQTLDAFARALAYFERPNRRADVAAVHTRAQGLYTKSVADQELERLRAKVVRDDSTEQKPHLVNRYRGLALRGALALLLAGVFATSGYALLTMAFESDPATDDAGNPLPPQPLSEAIGTAGERVREMVSDGVATGLSMAGLAINTGAAASTAVPPTPAPARTARARTAPAEGAVAEGEWSVSVRDVTATFLESEAAARAASAPIVSASDVSVALPLSPGAEPSMFSAADLEVDPATLVRPQLPSQARGAVADGSLAVLELVVDEHGTVERAQLASGRSRLNDKMLVSAAKAWVFEPARLRGEAVRYQLRIYITE